MERFDLCGRMLSSLFGSEQLLLWVRDLTADLPSPATVPGVEFRLGTPADAPLLAAAMGLGDDRLVQQRFAIGRTVFIGLANGRLLTYCWLSFCNERIGEIDSVIHIAPDEAYIWDCQTIPSERGRGLYPGLLSSIALGLRSAGKRRVWSATTMANRSSQRGFEKAGFARAATVTYRRWLLIRYRHLDLCPGLPTELQGAAVRACG